MKWAYGQMNSSAGVQQECQVSHNHACAAHEINTKLHGTTVGWQASHTKTGDAWKCNFAQHTSFFNDAPLFARQSTYDSWQQVRLRPWRELADSYAASVAMLFC